MFFHGTLFLFDFAFKCYFLSDRCIFVASTFCCLQFRMLLLDISVLVWYPIFCMPFLLDSNVKVVEIWPTMDGCVYVYMLHVYGHVVDSYGHVVVFLLLTY